MEDFYTKELERLINEQIKPVVSDEKILAVFAKFPRHLFVPTEYKNLAYDDEPVSIDYNQTTSQPSLIAEMIELLEPNENKKILEIGTGSGYQTALLSDLVKEVCSIEIVPQLAKEAKKRLEKLGRKNIKIKIGDGSEGWAEESPFDGIIVTAVAPSIPNVLIDQLKEGGKLVIPVNKDGDEKLMVGIKKSGKLEVEEKASVHFVPLWGKFGFKK